MSRRAAWGFWGLVLLGAASGCTPYLMATPRIYDRTEPDPFASVPPALQTPWVPILYATDRAPEETSTESDRAYTFTRSRSIFFGEATVKFGLDLTWEELKAASRTGNRKDPVQMTLSQVVETGRIPEPTFEVEQDGDKLRMVPSPRESQEMAEYLFNTMIQSRLAAAPRKDIFLFVHGYANTFQDATFTLAQVWHFLGRPGVPVAYSWPAGSGGLLRGYTHDRESGEFTVFHLKQVLRLLSRAKGLDRLHVIAHSRGTDVFMTALRELFLEDGRRVKGDCFAGKLGSVVLAAPDIDFDVLASRIVTEGLLMVPDRMTIYVSESDRAIGMSNWLFTSLKRLGRLSSADLRPEALEKLKEFTHIEVIDARVHGFGSWGHDYFYSHPAVSSDLIMLLRDRKEAGAAGGRPLYRQDNSFWILENDYPQAPEKK